MAEGKNYYIKVPGALVEVTEEVYLTYYRMRRRSSAVQEKDTYNGVTSYDALDTADTLGVDNIPDSNSPSVEDVVMSSLLQEKLHRCLAQLSECEQNMLYALYFQGMSEREVARATGMPQRTLHDRKRRVLAKLKKMMIS